MPNIELNTFYPWLQEDDIISQSWGIVESENLDWNRTGYGITLWPKPTKQVLTSTNIIRGIYNRSVSWVITNLFMYWDWWVVYRWDSVDNTPFYTLPSTDDIHNVIFSPSSKYYMAIQTATDTYSIGRINSDFTTWVNESVQTSLTSPSVPPMYQDGTFTYIWIWSKIYRYDTWDVETIFSLFKQYIVWITVHGTQFYVYSDNGNLSLWDGVSNSISANLDLGVNIRRVEQRAWIDYVTSESWDIYIMSGYQLVPISDSRQSRRLEDNSQYISKLNFNTWDEDNRTIAIGKKDTYFIANDTQPWIYKYWKLIEWLADAFYKITTEDNTNTDVDYIYWLFYIEWLNTLYYSYKQGSIYWVDKLELDNLTTAQSWYFVTQIFRWPPNLINKITGVKATTSYTSWSNYIKIYKRIDNWSWVLIRNINDATDTIKRHKITTNNGSWNLSDEFVDIQFKIEIYNDNQDNIPPLFHGIKLTYSINKN